MAILGLMSTESVTLDTYRWPNVRRRVFHQYPGGSAPLIALLSQMKEEDTNQPEFDWWEDRLKEQRTLTISQGSSKGPLLNAAGSDLSDNATLTAPAVTGATATEYQLCVADTSLFRRGHVFKTLLDYTSATGTKTVRGIVTSVVDSTHLKFYVQETVTALDNGTTNENVGKEVLVIGSSFPQGVVDLTDESYYFPVNPRNYTQVFRTKFSFTGDVLASPTKYDDTGPYKEKAKKHAINHMIEMEMAFLFGTKTKYVPTGTADPTTGVGLPRYTTGGIIYWMEQWEAGSLYENTAATADTDDNKRIIANAAGTMSEDTYDGYLERIFRTSNNQSDELVCFCGSGFLKTMNKMYRGQSVLHFMPPSGDTFGMAFVAHKTAFGTVYYKTHPLFSRNATLRNNGLYTNIHNLRYRPRANRDTQLLKNRQPRDADYRKDEWFTEAGLEFRMPETFMYLQNVTSYVP